MSKVIGIDLGTTNSCVSVIENGEPIVIPNSSGIRTTPSVVAFTANGERLIGDAALRQLATNSARTITSVKRHMGTNWTCNIDGKIYKPQMISAFVLMQLKKEAEDYLGCKLTDAVITVPAYFNDVQRQATKDAGAIAGLNVLRIVNEPTSAALSYGLNHGEPQKVMVFDLGGGTFDVSIIEIGEGVIEVLATAGDNHLGGDDFDERLSEWILSDYKINHGIDLRKDPIAVSRVKEAAEKAKKELSVSSVATINLPFISKAGNEPVHLEMTVSRSKFESLISDLVERCVGPVQNALSDAGIAASELSKVLLVGGSTRVPYVANKVKSIIGIEPSKNINPDECVAMGAAVLGSTITGNALSIAGGYGVGETGQGAGGGLLLLDVTPMSLSIETLGGVATRLIERNTTLPAKFSRVFTTAAPYQSNVEIIVLQGERPMARDNKCIGKFKLKGIRKAMAGVPQIEVTFDIDTNGILKVSARDLDTQKEQSITISADDRMSDAEIKQAMQDAAMYASLDHIRTRALSELSEARILLGKAERALKDGGKTIDKLTKKNVKKDAALLAATINKIRVDKITNEQVDNLVKQKEQLNSSAGELIKRFE